MLLLNQTLWEIHILVVFHDGFVEASGIWMKKVLPSNVLHTSLIVSHENFDQPEVKCSLYEFEYFFNIAINFNKQKL